MTLGIGDDAALWQPSRSHRSAISTDMQVEGVHFTRDMMSLEDIGWRAMASALSDLAAMGARPVLATVGFAFPRETQRDELLEVYRGLTECARRFKTAIVGGDLSVAPSLALSITVVGEVRPSDAKTRAGARAGDAVAVTGPLGAARAGLELSRRPLALPEERAAAALQAFRRPQPRLAEGRFFAASRNVTAMMDCSDGLATDLARLADAGACAATVECVPLHDAARDVAALLGEDPEKFALAGGEEYELIVAIRPRAFAHLSGRYAERFNRPLLRVGTFRNGSGVTWNGAPLERSGWDHFTS
ncbi:MAG: thiamine-phosphate kinase [Candidatus Eremiobacteraeota bacterium]|nr:thiamine-phosphate kinase [Candidatus Eremiobacteraeota bacterium]MBV9262979.1 thiamine-phosphate kinase [Candidatus Eremiobacteraeota bacterium]